MGPDHLLQYISDGYLAVDRDWCIRAANPRAEGLLLRHGKQLVGCQLWEVIPDVEGRPAQEAIRTAGGGRVPRRVEHFSPSKYIWLEMLVVPGTDGCELFLQNVSNRAQVMESQAVRAAVRRILMQAPMAVTITRGPEHRYEMVNEHAQALVGRRDLEGQLARNAFPELQGSGLFELLDEVYRTGAPYVGRNVPVRYDREGDGTLVDAVFDFTYQPLLEPDGSVWGVMSVAVDVTAYVNERERLAGEAPTTGAPGAPPGRG
jgi:PAS domain-containing protein